MGANLLFEPNRHEAVDATAWDAPRALEAVRSIVRDIEQSRLAEGHWPVHPLDADGGEPPRTGYKSLYLGSAGVLWTLWFLQRAGAVQLGIDPGKRIEQAHAAYLADPDTGEVVPSYFLGEAGLLLVRWRLTGSRATADRLYASVQANVRNPTNEALWGAPGTMLAAWHLWEASGEERWRTLFLENVEPLWQSWVWDDKARCPLWTQDLYGSVVQYLGAGHGFAGNVYPLLKGASVLDESRREELYARCLATVRTLARRDGVAVNWPSRTTAPRSGGLGLLLQWCHGAPGFVTALADFPAQRSAEMEDLLTGAGLAVWAAGPLIKGYGLCHGTAGNGYAFLKLYRRTRDPLWLDRARAFAMHAIAQQERMRHEHGRGRFTLWTGDPGLAVYLWHCLEGAEALPALDALD